MSAALDTHFQPEPERLTTFEIEFVRTVLEHRGLFNKPTESDFANALQVLRRYDEQCIANPGYDSGYAPHLCFEDMAALRAKAYLMFATIRPTAAQWHKAHGALFGPLLCETCG